MLVRIYQNRWSSWEESVMSYLDLSENVLEWAFEEIEIDYVDPTVNKERKYIPDFIVVVKDGDNVKIKILEVKPSYQASLKYAEREEDRIAVRINESKWQYAKDWCLKKTEEKDIPFEFEVLTEFEIYKGERL